MLMLMEIMTLTRKRRILRDFKSGISPVGIAIILGIRRSEVEDVIREYVNGKAKKKEKRKRK